MLMVYHILSGRWDTAAAIHPHACRMVYDLKGHVSMPLAPDTVHNAHRQRRGKHIRNLFWLCYIFDKDIAIRYGRPPYLTRDYCDLTLPDNLTSMYTDRPGSAQVPTPTSDDAVVYYPQDLHLCQIKERLCLFLCSLDNSSLSDGTILCQVRQLDLDLETWRSSITLAYRPKLAATLDQPLLSSQMSFLQRRVCLNLQLEYNYLTAVIHTAVRRCGAVYAVDDNLPEDLHSVYHSSSDLSLEASRMTLHNFRDAKGLLQEELFGNMAFYPPIAAMALFMNILIHPHDKQAQEDLGVLAASVTIFQDLSIRKYGLGTGRYGKRREKEEPQQGRNLDPAFAIRKDLYELLLYATSYHWTVNLNVSCP
ncbi:hypothetical protein IL306_010194 [Fusarium sp. DS 682]|nr:hypothetical protein IL306_010194 [Fusarium sp. DS 682]